MVYIKSEVKTEEDVWHCITCDQTMLESQSSAHLDNKAHIRMLQSQSQLQTAPRTHASQDNDLRYTHHRLGHRRFDYPQSGHDRKRPHGAWGSPRKRKPGQKFWTCPKCRETMTINKKSAHVCCKRENGTIGRLEMWSCDDCGIEVATTLREDHLRAAEHAVNAAMYIPPHPNGKRYIKIKDVRRVYNHIRPIPVKCYRPAGAYRGRWKGGVTFVTAEDVEMVLKPFNGKGNRDLKLGGDYKGEYDCKDEYDYKDEYHYKDMYL
ncbi:hypothetical protein BO78DRAFT_398090 [Aspergillus sclerotiicarbonarius CBS 121057]|uniref:Uncharacterized protein n=1 Tax=Aspergillus sclerotiicarbonarius (strain CBS 121057 / IBT 28362) TaxID=1448318 RepID=A0A319E657_ASPSB|nr:hypothetical protein BO78DRAFT_398090 [Aspergillus sclerotiicarbonarius CBS 121057]